MVKKHFFWIFVCLGLNSQAQIINFPDVDLKNVLLTMMVDTDGDGITDADVDTNNDGEIDQTEALQVHWLNINSSDISDLTGIEYFTQITDLYLSEVHVASINLSNFSLLWRIICSDTSITEINLCGTNVRTLWCLSNPNLTTLYLKNGVVSSDLAKNESQIPPQLHNFEFWDSPMLNYVCYDEGEYDAVFHGIGQNTAGITLTTGCNNTCALLNPVATPNHAFMLYPNPTTNLLHIQADANTVKEVVIYNALGQKLFSATNEDSVDVSHLSQGSYFITVVTDNGKTTQQFIKI